MNALAICGYGGRSVDWGFLDLEPYSGSIVPVLVLTNPGCPHIHYCDAHRTFGRGTEYCFGA